MPDAYKLNILTELRKEQGITLEEMARHCGFHSKRGRDSVGNWERGHSVPHPERRTKFMQYLCNVLKLESDKFGEVWEILEQEWGWDPLSDQEWQRYFKMPRSTKRKKAQLAEAILPLEPVKPPEVSEFIGREAELVYFADKLSTNHLAVIMGMPGIGKTWLAAKLARRTGDLQKVFWHSFREGEGTAAVLWELAGFLAWHGHDDLWQQLQVARQIAGKPPPSDVMFEYVIQKIGGRGFLLCFDDYQFVDQVPLMNRFVRRLLEETLPKDTALIVTSRRMPEFAQTTEFEALAGFSLADTTGLLTKRGLSLPAELVADLHSRIEGNAKLLTLAASALKRSSSPKRFLTRLAEATDIERYLMRELYERLSKDERDVMGAVAVLMDDTGTRDAIEAVLNRGGTQRILNRLRDRYLLAVTEGETDREYGQHAIVQAFYYNLLGRRKRRPMHRRAGEYYEAFETDTLKAARHFLEAEDYVRAAGLTTVNVWDVINRGQSGKLLQLLKLLADRRIGAELRTKVSIAQGQVHDLWGEGQLAQECYRAALDKLAALRKSPSVRKLWGRACRGMGESLQYESPQAAMSWLRRGLDELGGADALEEAILHIHIGRTQVGQGEYTAALSELECGLALLPAGPSHWHASALANMGLIYCTQGDVESGESYYRRALEISEQLHDYWIIVGMRHNLAIEMETAGDWESAVLEYGKAHELAERLGSVSFQTELVLSLGILCTKQGNTKVAYEYLSKCIELARQHSLNEQLIHGLSSLADLRIRQGEWDAAEGLLNEAEQLASKIGTKYQLPEIYRGWALVHLAQGQVQAAIDLAERSIDLARELDLDIDEDMSLRVLGQALHANGQQEQAVAAFEKSLSILADRDPYEAARTKVEWARCLNSTGNTEQGTPLFQAARATFEQLGARCELAEVDDFVDKLARGAVQ